MKKQPSDVKTFTIDRICASFIYYIIHTHTHANGDVWLFAKKKNKVPNAPELISYRIQTYKPIFRL